MYDYEKEHGDYLRRNSAECAVLLKTDGRFPLESPCRIALYGSGARRTVKGGTGSGEVNSSYFITAEDGLEHAGFTVTTKGWMDRYDELWLDAKKRFIRDLKRSALKRGTLAILDNMGAVMPEPEYDLPLDAEGEAAVYVLARISGEGSDRCPVPGDILLTETEQRDILALNEKYERFLLVLNVGGVVDLSPVAQVKNILLISQLGMETGNILSDIVLGKSFPSGKLTTSWFAWEDHSDAGTFGDRYDTLYNEGLYVGYRYFDAAGKQPLFPFGYGLSWTSFELAVGQTSEADGFIKVGVSVTNTGTRNGKEVAQLYVSKPAGKLHKPYKDLAAFAKTDELRPGEKQDLILSFDLRDLASYDPERALWILEPGDYVLRVGTSSGETEPAAVVRLSGEARIRQVKNCLGDPSLEEWIPEKCAEESLPELPVLTVDAASFQTEFVDYTPFGEVDEEIEKLGDDELCLMNIGAFKRKGSKSVIGSAAQSVPGAAGETVGSFTGTPSMILADGPAGVRISRRYYKDEKGVHSIGSGMPESVMELMPAPAAFVMRLMEGNKKPTGEICEQNCSAIPIGTALAQSWNLAFAEQCGDLVGDEMERFGIHLWLAPALNIHRDIRCGRNYEYYSEDPLLSGLFSAAVTKGVQKHPSCGTTVKHFAANNQETNRYGNNSVVSERALREIYLKGFEIAVRESQPHAVMTSYNLLNGVHTSERSDLVEDVLRAEFGFQGIVMTDWIIAGMNAGKKKYAAPNAAKIAAAGGDLVMPGGKGDLKKMKKGLKNGTLSRRRLMINVTRVNRMAKKLTAKQEV